MWWLWLWCGVGRPTNQQPNLCGPPGVHITCGCLFAKLELYLRLSPPTHQPQELCKQAKVKAPSGRSAAQHIATVPAAQHSASPHLISSMSRGSSVSEAGSSLSKGKAK